MGGLVTRAIGALLIVALLPLLAILGMIVLVTMGRPIIFTQQRSGRNRQAFTIRKFRSMRDAFDASGKPLPDEDRTTPFGKFLRRSRLDELPGLLNVARGEMAFVGPRPLLPETIAALGKRGERRGSVRPGLTGWAQVNGNTLLTLDEKIALDLWYVDHQTPSLDFRIVLMTAWVMVGGERKRIAAPTKPIS